MFIFIQVFELFHSGLNSFIINCAIVVTHSIEIWKPKHTQTFCKFGLGTLLFLEWVLEHNILKSKNPCHVEDWIKLIRMSWIHYQHWFNIIWSNLIHNALCQLCKVSQSCMKSKCHFAHSINKAMRLDHVARYFYVKLVFVDLLCLWDEIHIQCQAHLPEILGASARLHGRTSTKALSTDEHLINT